MILAAAVLPLRRLHGGLYAIQRKLERMQWAVAAGEDWELVSQAAQHIGNAIAVLAIVLGDKPSPQPVLGGSAAGKRDTIPAPSPNVSPFHLPHGR